MARSAAGKSFSLDPQQTYAVLTGDVVASSELPREQRRKLPNMLEQAGKALPESLAKAAPYRLAVFSGDSWQLLLSTPSAALRVATFIRAYMLANTSARCDTRIAIGLGKVEFVPRGDVRKAEGEAFRLSGRALEALTDRCRMQLIVGDSLAADAAGWVAAVPLLDALIRNDWTEARARAVVGALHGWTQARIAELWDEPIKQSTVSAHLLEADWDTAEAFFAAWERWLAAPKAWV